MGHKMPGTLPASQQTNSLSKFLQSRHVHLPKVKNLAREITDLVSSKNKKSHVHRFKLEQDVEKLRERLRQETELHVLLQNATTTTKTELSCSSSLPCHIQDLLSNIAVLDARVSMLEQERISLHFQIIQERNERRLAQYHLRHSVSQSVCSYDAVGQNSADWNEFIANNGSTSCDKYRRTLARIRPSKGLGTDNNANELSKEMVRCMRNIFVSLGESSSTRSKSSARENRGFSPREQASPWKSPSERSRKIPRWVQSPRIDVQNNSDVLATENNVFDPYKAQGKLSWADIGSYRTATEVSWMSVEDKRLEYASEELFKFRILVERLARVNPTSLSHSEKLAFWINIYNALIMHAYLAYGVPKSDLKLFSLMQKAAYTVGGHSYSAAAIEYVILKMNPPLHRPQIALLVSLVKLKVSNEQQLAAIDAHEPLASFALSSGTYSSPAVRIYTAENLREELEDAQRDYVQASVGISPRGKLLVPKMLHCFAKNLVDDDSEIGLWISGHLPPRQAAFVEQCVTQRRRWSFLGSNSGNCGVVPFDSRFRYLFLP
ncbi:PREDICTED: uncharacterized protein LOC104812341 [Tarenaya hassleriana]|uniref:uncharacterized protein LOC104812341 n=1 Tax=Tarenaya hassleriana TaxID=28532 RepID=UPI00053C1948|nr:PREDICTED: uncharacterized protein LOC104812341 [Tarenaya hassleriana]